MGETDMGRYVFVTRPFAHIVNAGGPPLRAAPALAVGLAFRKATPAFCVACASIVNTVQIRKLNTLFHTVPLSKNRAGRFFLNFNFYLRLRG